MEKTDLKRSATVCLYFADLLLACLTFHLMVCLIARENGTAKQFKLSLRNIISIITYTMAALGGFCPIAAYIVVAIVSCWWIFT